MLEREEDYSTAKNHFEAALSINPYHVKSMTYLVCTFIDTCLPLYQPKAPPFNSIGTNKELGGASITLVTNKTSPEIDFKLSYNL